jgi:hypothetical protein
MAREPAFCAFGVPSYVPKAESRQGQAGRQKRQRVENFISVTPDANGFNHVARK